MSKRPVTIVIPVYGDWPSLTDCIESLKLHVNFKDGHKVVLVNDCGPDVELMETNIRNAIKGNDSFSYYRNNENLGFVGTCNRAVLEIDASSSNDVLLLNSDTIVTAGFLDELTTLLHDNPLFGAISPRTNNATIATIPISEIQNKGIEHAAAYDIYNTIRDMMPRYSITPVAHGFCMLIRRECIDKFGLFDPIFGKGYGEETDFCMRINAGGYVCALSNRSFVFHMEARSFSIETKNKLLEQNSKIMWQRYPFYRDVVRNYLENDMDAVDRFAHIISAYNENSYLIDIRGLHLVHTPSERKKITDNVKQFQRAKKDGKVSFLIDGPRPAELTIHSSDTLSEKSIKGTFAIAYRPLDPTSIKSLTILNRHALKIITTLSSTDSMIRSSNDANTTDHLLASYLIQLSNVIVSHDGLMQIFPNATKITTSSLEMALKAIDKTSLDAYVLRTRWQTFTNIELLMNSTSPKTPAHRSLKEKAKSTIVRVPLLHRVARKARTTLNR